MGDGQLLGHRLRDEVRHRGRQEDVAFLGRRGKRVVLSGDELGHASGGPHISTSAPMAWSCTASPTIGSTSPRDPYVANNTRISYSPLRSPSFGQRLCGTTGVLPQAPEAKNKIALKTSSRESQPWSG